MNIKTFIIIVILFILLNVIGYVTRPAKYRTQGLLPTTSISMNLSNNHSAHAVLPSRLS